MYLLDDNEGESGNEDEGESEVKTEKVEPEVKPEQEIKPNSTTNNAILNNPNIDNPYLRAATLPKKARPDPSLVPVTNTSFNPVNH